MALSMFLVTTPAASPYLDEFARFMTSSIVQNFNIDMTGPNISSFAIVISSSTSAKTVG